MFPFALPKFSAVMIGALLAFSSALVHADTVTVRFDGRPVFKVGPNATLSARDRAREIEQRMSAVVESRPASAIEVEIVREGPDRRIEVHGSRIVTVTPADAEDQITDVDQLARTWARAIEAALRASAESRSSPARRFGTNILASIRAAFGGVAESAITLIPRIIAAALVLAMFWLAASLVRLVLRWLFRRIISDRTIENLLKQLGYYTVWALGLIVAVDALGINRGSLVTGLGLTGLALGFALKDILSNFVSGLLLLGLRPFRVGDQIVVGESEGTVERVRLRATEIRTYDGRVVLVPNATIFTSRMTNNTASTVRRVSFGVRLGYNVELARALEVFVAAVRTTPGVLETPAPSVHVADISGDDALVELRFWTDSRRSDLVKTLAAARQAVWEAAQRAAVPLPDPAARVVALARTSAG